MQSKTGKRIQTVANVILVLEIVSSVIYWIVLLVAASKISEFYGSSGLAVGTAFVVLIVGCIVAYVSWLLLKGYGEIVENQAEQTSLLIKLTDRFERSIPAVNPGTVYNAFARKSDNTETPASLRGNDEESQKTARFATRLTDDVVCPNCGKRQLPSRNLCYSCGCKFIYDDEGQHDESKWRCGCGTVNEAHYAFCGNCGLNKPGTPE